MKKMFRRFKADQRGQVLPIVLVLLLAGSLVAVPSLNFVQTSLHTGEVVEENVDGLYAADAGVEDAFWRLMNNPWPSFPYTYTLLDASGQPRLVNGMTVQVTIDYIPAILGEEVDKIGVHEDWVQIKKYITWDETTQKYLFTLELIDWYTPSAIKIENITIFDLPGEFFYVMNSTGGDITTGNPDETRGASSLTLSWDIQPPYTMQKYDPHAGPMIVHHTFNGNNSLCSWHRVTLFRVSKGTKSLGRPQG